MFLPKIYKDKKRNSPYLSDFLSRNKIMLRKRFLGKRKRGYLVSNTAVKQVRQSQQHKPEHVVGARVPSYEVAIFFNKM